MTRPVRLAVVILAGAGFVLAGCGHSDEVVSAPSPTPPVVRPLPPGVVPAADLPGSVANQTEARKQVAVSACQKTDHGWQATGTAHNPGDRPTAYEVTIFFTTSAATVIDWAQTKVEVKPGATKDWTVSKDFTAPPDVRCVLRGAGHAQP